MEIDDEGRFVPVDVASTTTFDSPVEPAPPAVKPDAPAVEPDVPAVVEPDAPAVEPDAPAVEPDVPAAVEPDAPAVEPDAPAVVEPDVPAVVEPDAPAVEPDVPAVVEPDVPAVVEPDAPAVEPDVAAVVKPDVPAVEPDVPAAVEPDVPAVVEPDAPAVEPDAPAAVEPDVPAVVEPDAPAVEPDVAAVVKPDVPAVEPDVPAVEPDAPVVEPDVPVVEPTPPEVEPDVTAAVKPDAPVVVEPDAPAVVEPDAPAVEPDVPVVEPTPPAVEPDVAAVVKPDAPVVVEPDVPAVVEPDAPPAAEPTDGPNWLDILKGLGAEITTIEPYESEKPMLDDEFTFGPLQSYENGFLRGISGGPLYVSIEVVLDQRTNQLVVVGRTISDRYAIIDPQTYLPIKDMSRGIVGLDGEDMIVISDKPKTEGLLVEVNGETERTLSPTQIPDPERTIRFDITEGVLQGRITGVEIKDGVKEFLGTDVDPKLALCDTLQHHRTRVLTDELEKVLHPGTEIELYSEGRRPTQTAQDFRGFEPDTVGDAPGSLTVYSGRGGSSTPEIVSGRAPSQNRRQSGVYIGAGGEIQEIEPDIDQGRDSSSRDGRD